MPAITFIHPDGRSDRVETSDGESAMQAATRHGLDGILAECGRSEEHTSELQSQCCISYAVFCL